ncbi:MAG: nucleotidyltransferase family protein [Fulvivirga sp.]
MRDYKEHLIVKGSALKIALAQLDKLASDAILFVVDEEKVLRGSLTDGDVRRGLIRGLTTDDIVDSFIQPDPKYIQKSNYSLDKIIELREKRFKVVPVLDEGRRVVSVVNFVHQNSYLPIDAVVMAGGRGERLRPLTDTTPKPLLKVGNKAIMEHNMNRLIRFGIDDFWVSVRYLSDQIIEYFGNGRSKGVSIEYLHEEEPLGTIGAVAQIKNLKHDTVLITNSDLLTNLDYEDFYLSFIKEEADLSVVTIPYDIKVPYAVLETSNGVINSFKEKPTYTYYANGGIYLVKADLLRDIPKDTFFDATDFLERLIESGKKVHSYVLRGYWLDIGRPSDYDKAQEDIKHIKL